MEASVPLRCICDRNETPVVDSVHSFDRSAAALRQPSFSIGHGVRDQVHSTNRHNSGTQSAETLLSVWSCLHSRMKTWVPGTMTAMRHCSNNGKPHAQTSGFCIHTAGVAQSKVDHSSDTQISYTVCGGD